MIDPHRLLISKIVEEGSLRLEQDARVTPDFFPEEHRAVFAWIQSYWTRFHKVPGAAILRSEFPTYDLIRGAEPHEAYLEEVRRRRRFEIVYGVLGDAVIAVESEEVDTAIALLKRGLLQAETEVTELRDTDVMQTWKQRLETYAEWKKHRGTLRGIPSGFPTFDAVLGGYQNGQLITYLGEPKAGKSTLLLRTALEAHGQNYIPLFVGFEMSNDEQTARYDSMVSGVDYVRIMAGRTDPHEDRKLARALEKMEGKHPFVLSADPSGTTISGIAAKVETYQPDVVFIDGVYLMQDEQNGRDDREKLTNLTRGLKRLATQIDRPIIIATQALTWKINKSQGLQQSSIGYSSSFAQDSDVIIGIESLENPEEPIRKLKIVTARNAPYREILVSWDWTTGEFNEATPQDAPLWTLNGQAEEPAPEAPKKRRKKIVRVNHGS
jgi:replicative DNA helicase